MPKDLNEAASGTVELIFPDEATGQYSLEELSVYEASEVRDEIGEETPKYGNWLPVIEDDTGTEAWLNAPSRLLVSLDSADVRPTETFRIETMQKSGPGQSDQYQVEVTFPNRDGNGTQQGLSTATND